MRAWRRIESARVIAVCDIVEKRAAETATRSRIPSHYTELEDMIQREKLQFLSICTPPQIHTDAVCKAISSGVNVVVEKPLAMTVKEVQQIVEVSRGTKAKLTVISNLLFKPAVTRARRILASLHQQPISADISFLKFSGDSIASNPSHWCHNLPGGIFAELLPHPIYLIMSFLGDLQVRGIYLDKLGACEWIRCDELKVFLGSSERHATIHASLNRPSYATFLDLYGQNYGLRADLGTNDVYVLRDPKRRLFGKGVDSLRQTLAVVENNLHLVYDTVSYHSGVYRTPHELNIRSFVESVTSEQKSQPLLMTLQDAYKMTQIQENITTLIDRGNTTVGKVD